MCSLKQCNSPFRTALRTGGTANMFLKRRPGVGLGCAKLVRKRGGKLGRTMGVATSRFLGVSKGKAKGEQRGFLWKSHCWLLPPRGVSMLQAHHLNIRSFRFRSYVYIRVSTRHANV